MRALPAWRRPRISWYLKRWPVWPAAPCEALDHMDINGIVGTLAGENTVFVVMRDNASAETFCQEIQEML